MGFSAHDIPKADVAFGQVTPVEPTARPRPVTATEREDMEAVKAALAVWDEAMQNGPPELDPSFTKPEDDAQPDGAGTPDAADPDTAT